MNRVLPLIVVALAILAFATLLLVAGPAAQIRSIDPPEGLAPYTAAELRGRNEYISLGCVYCHSQQPRSPEQAPDVLRGWGRPSTAADYVYDEPHLLGTMRTGPDLLNAGARLPSRAWQLTHLYQPRAIVPQSIMPAFPFLFEAKEQAAQGDVVVKVPARHRPEGKVIVARQEALDLVDYLLSLDRTYPAERTDLRDNGFMAQEEDS
ncbi:cytochrome c oxidase cbb3-type subunit 2 [Modicisalibacter ilicicola DSM 19980]|uniref:Cytochrome c oxidase cbb3-type subunit 2 n=1 Tax=Modicisalibacter ilicicola DSM 19980 TaxID=1121942 RepID=A0A1M5AWI5_9GAMM|nr:cbb3-type cytochrome c oxidase subunit II [Halomonas ilicicola]SHF34634.1 cytochrome c oxidase cbb3-type subunit 2 [Halomonas ilicicola DSM 19980]